MWAWARSWLRQGQEAHYHALRMTANSLCPVLHKPGVILANLTIRQQQLQQPLLKYPRLSNKSHYRHMRRTPLATTLEARRTGPLQARRRVRFPPRLVGYDVGDLKGGDSGVLVSGKHKKGALRLEPSSCVCERGRS